MIYQLASARASVAKSGCVANTVAMNGNEWQGSAMVEWANASPYVIRDRGSGTDDLAPVQPRAVRGGNTDRRGQE